MEYNFNAIEKKWQQYWQQNSTYQVSNQSAKPKYYVLDMFPYPSGAGLHVGHPLGYIASDIFSRYKRLKGFNVLHPMGYDAFGLPAEQYAIEKGVHPAISTAENIQNFRAQLDKIGFCYDWTREVNTSKPNYYKWTQWIFLQLFNSYFNRVSQKAEPIETLIAHFEKEGNELHAIPNSGFVPAVFSSSEWFGFTEKTKQEILMQYRLAFCGYGEVNWCEALGTVLANDEVVNGVSERGGHPVVKKKLRQWYLRITEYADRLQDGLNTIDFSESMKEMQINWIGKSYGAEITFDIESEKGLVKDFTVYTTRPDTLFGVDFMVIAPELDWIKDVKSAAQSAAVDDYIAYVNSRSDRERQAEKRISGCFTGAYAIHPFNGKKIPIWMSEYVLAGYGTGAIMAVPCGDERDFKFARHFNIPITNIIGEHFNGEEANATKDAILENSDFLNGLVMRDAMAIATQKLTELGIGKRKVNYKMRDAAFSRQRYWGEPFPIIWEDGVAIPLDESELPLELPEVDGYSQGPEGEGPLANIEAWTNRKLETNTMPGYAGSSWYFLRYMDPGNDQEFCSRPASDYWNQVDLYIGGTEHAVGHLLYSRLWTKVLFDLGHIGFDEPFKKLLNQGMITGNSRFIYRLKFRAWTKEIKPQLKTVSNLYISHGIYEKMKAVNSIIVYFPNEFMSILGYNSDLAIHMNPDMEDNIDKIRVDVRFVDGTELNLAQFRSSKDEYNDAVFILENGSLNVPNSVNQSGPYLCGAEIEKMSKSKYNTVNPDDLVEKYGADTFRMYEMFLGPVEQSKPWDTKGIEGVHRFLKKLWRLFFDEQKGLIITDGEPTAAELKALHRTIKKIEDDTERFSFNTAVSAFMIAVNELYDLKCHNKQILEQLLIMLTPYAPHIAEELYAVLGKTTSITDAAFPVYNATYTVESSKEYPISVNGKLRTTMMLPLDAAPDEIQTTVLASELVQKWLDGKELKKFIFVKGKMVNLVV